MARLHSFWRLDLQVTEACNLACPYCFARHGRGGDMPPSVARQAVRWLISGASDKAHITLWGGEPLTRLPLLRSVVDDAREQARSTGKTLSLSMPTNATLLTDEALAWVDDNDVRIFLSIDGDAETQAERPLRGGASSFALANAGLRRAISYPLRRRPAVRMTITPTNAARLASNVDFFIDRGVRELLMYPTFDGSWSETAIQQYASAQLALSDSLIERIGRCHQPSDLPRFKAWLPILGRLLEGAPRRPRSGMLRHCGVGQALIAVGIDGRLWPCHRLLFYQRARGGADHTLGALDQGVDASATARWSKLRIEKMRGVQQCIECDSYDLCTISCLAINFAGTGQLHRVPAAACALMNAQIAACRRVVDSLAGDPRLALYAGQSLSSTLRQASVEIGQRAWQLYCNDPPVR